MAARRTLLGARLRSLALGCLLAGPLVVSGTGRSSEVTVVPEMTRPYLEQTLTLLAALQDTIDRSAFDVDALVLHLASEGTPGIAAWVAREVAFEPYSGVLRGARGTLTARAGNAFDQALLLDALLRGSGVASRVVVGRLDEAQAATLLRQSLRPRAAPPDIGDPERLDAALVDLAVWGGLPADTLTSLLAQGSTDPMVGDPALLREVGERHDELMAALGSAGVVLGDGAEADLLAEARDYAWVEARPEADGPWIAYHPTGVAFGEALVATGLLEEELDRWAHRIRVEAWIEREVDGQHERVPIMRPYERLAAEVMGQVLDYTHRPVGVDLEPIGAFDLDGALAEAVAFVPVFAGGDAPEALAFKLDGSTVSPSAVGRPPSLAGALAERAATALGAFGGATESQTGPDTRLVGQGIDLILVAPGGGEISHRRWWLEPEVVAGAPRDPIAAGRALLRHDRIVVMSGAVAPGYLLDEALAAVLDLRGLLLFAVDQVANPDPDARLDPAIIPAPSAAAHLQLVEVFDLPLALAGDAPGFRSGPSVVILGTALMQGGARHYIDIVSNPRRVLAVDARGEPLVAAEATLRRGVWETIAEREVLGGPTTDALAAASARGPFVVVRPGDDPAALLPWLDAVAVQRLREQLENGFVALLPTDPTVGSMAWWRVDPASGTVLGVTADGRGQATTEYVAEYIKGYTAVAGALVLMHEFYRCRERPTPESQFCCMVVTIMGGGAGYGLGAFVGAIAFGAPAMTAAVAGLMFTAISSVPGAFDWENLFVRCP